MKFYVEAYRPPFPEKGAHYRVHREKGFNRDLLSPNMTAVLEVSDVKNREEAIASVIECVAKINTKVKRVY